VRNAQLAGWQAQRLRDSPIFLSIYHLAFGVAQIRPGTQVFLWIVVHRQPLD
jgi:hypothetical protein